METYDYEEPESWDDKGLDWDNPDPRNVDYVMAIRRALMERLAAIHAVDSAEIAKISPHKPVTVKTIEAFVTTIYYLSSSFVNVDFWEYKEDYSDFPRMWTYRELILEDGCDLYNEANPGELLVSGGAWLKAIRKAINKLTVVKCSGAWGWWLKRYGTIHDPAFDESISTALGDAMNDEKGLSRSTFSTTPTKIYAWSGNTHWRCPVPDREDDEDNINGYCGYAESAAIKFRRVRSWLVGRELDLKAYAIVTAPTGAVPYSQELATSVFDAGESGFREGLNLETFHVEDPLDMDVTFGNVDSIPQNAVVPTSDFDEEGSATWRRSAKRGYTGKTVFLLDYGCENGFRFRETEE